MRDLYYLEIHERSRSKHTRIPPSFTPYRAYYRTSGPRNKMMRLGMKMERRGWRTVMYKKQYARSSHYREVFFRENTPKDGTFHCVYCGRKLTKSEVHIDHVIPVGAAKQGGRAARMLAGRNVNDPSNLVAACYKCNKAKADSYSYLWCLRASLGQNPGYFRIRTVLRILLIAAALFVLIYFGLPELIRYFSH